MNIQPNIQPKIEGKKYRELIYEVNNEKIKIPQFQRDFVWSLEDTANLLDSVLKGYPIGTFILWETGESLRSVSVKEIGGGLAQSKNKQGENVQYVLDGQQRITSLFAAYKGAKIPKHTKAGKKTTYINYENIHVRLDVDDGDTDEPIVVAKPQKGWVTMPFTDVLNSQSNLNAIKKKFSDEQFTKIYRYLVAFETYEFSTVTLRSDDATAAIHVFTRINTKGKVLTIFEIMAAKTYEEPGGESNGLSVSEESGNEPRGFDMTKKFEDLQGYLEEKGYETMPPEIILRTLAFVLGAGKCTKKAILQLGKQEIIDHWDKVIDALKMSIDYFNDHFRVSTSALLPSYELLVSFSYFFYHQKVGEVPSQQQKKLLEEFFWQMSLGSRYSRAADTFLAKDVNKSINAIREETPPGYEDIKISFEPQDLIDRDFNTGHMFCKAILCLLASFQPKNFTDGSDALSDNSWLKQAGSKHYHRFFPASYAKDAGLEEQENSMVNIALASASLNKGSDGAKPPSSYIGTFNSTDECLASHLIGNRDEFGIKTDNYQQFLNARAKRICKEMKAKTTPA